MVHDLYCNGKILCYVAGLAKLLTSESFHV